MATYWENSCSFGLRYVSWFKYLIVSLFFSYLGLWSGNLFLNAPFPDLCILVPSHNMFSKYKYLIVILVFPLVFSEWECLIALFPAYLPSLPTFTFLSTVYSSKKKVVMSMFPKSGHG